MSGLLFGDKILLNKKRFSYSAQNRPPTEQENIFLFSRALAQEAWQAGGPWKVLGGSGDHPVSGLLFGAKILLNKRGPNKKMPHVGQGGLVFLF